ncbi:lipid-A-disaccharide synthase N-terminal domain-containing protein [Pontiella sp.]|uniref:lipid-A-disaccharide synthase N-terminal domain-containing protein n=1 Tax=Pontiella sp. TaxID=2837462 RepID=UPI0035615D4C
MDGWLIAGLFAQILFTARFVIQWIASERAGESVVPELFWFFSLSGSLLLLVYAIHRKDPVFILGQSAGVFIYLRNIHLILRKKKCATPATT